MPVARDFNDKYITTIITKGPIGTIITPEKNLSNTIIILVGPNYLEHIPAASLLCPLGSIFKILEGVRYKIDSLGAVWDCTTCFLVRESHCLCSYQWSPATKRGLHRRVSLPLSFPDWPRSEVMADAVSTSWVSFRSSSSIHLHYKRKQVSVEPLEADVPENFLVVTCLAGTM